MLKKLALGIVIVCTVPFLSPSFRLGYKRGWNQSIDEAHASGTDTGPFHKFKNV